MLKVIDNDTEHEDGFKTSLDELAREGARRMLDHGARGRGPGRLQTAAAGPCRREIVDGIQQERDEEEA